MARNKRNTTDATIPVQPTPSFQDAMKSALLASAALGTARGERSSVETRIHMSTLAYYDRVADVGAAYAAQYGKMPTDEEATKYASDIVAAREATRGADYKVPAPEVSKAKKLIVRGAEGVYSAVRAAAETFVRGFNDPKRKPPQIDHVIMEALGTFGNKNNPPRAAMVTDAAIRDHFNQKASTRTEPGKAPAPAALPSDPAALLTMARNALLALSQSGAEHVGHALDALAKVTLPNKPKPSPVAGAKVDTGSDILAGNVPDGMAIFQHMTAEQMAAMAANLAALAAKK